MPRREESEKRGVADLYTRILLFVEGVGLERGEKTRGRETDWRRPGVWVGRKHIPWPSHKREGKGGPGRIWNLKVRRVCSDQSCKRENVTNGEKLELSGGGRSACREKARHFKVGTATGRSL